MPVRILCVDRKHHEYPVIGLVFAGEDEYTYSWKSNGCTLIDGSNSPLDLIEVSKYEDFKVDDLCVVSDYSDYSGNKFFRYFANGKKALLTVSKMVRLVLQVVTHYSCNGLAAVKQLLKKLLLKLSRRIKYESY